MIRAVLLVDADDHGGGRRHVDLLVRSWSKPYQSVRPYVLPMHGLVDLPAILRSVRGLRADVIHSHSRRTGVIGRLVGRWAEVPAIHTYHGLHPERWSRAWMFLERRLARWTARLVHVSWSQGRLGELSGVPGDVVPNGLDHARIAASLKRAATRASLGLAASDFVIGAIGRWQDPVKGIERLRQVEPICPAGRILLIGPRPTVQLNGRSVMLGPVDDPVRYLPACDVFAAPADAEGLPYAPMEAMAAGLPVVATAVRGHIDLVTPETGWLTWRDHFSDGILEAEQAGPVERARRGAYGRTRVKEFTAERTAAMLAAIYREVA